MKMKLPRLVKKNLKTAKIVAGLLLWLAVVGASAYAFARFDKANDKPSTNDSLQQSPSENAPPTGVEPEVDSYDQATPAGNSESHDGYEEPPAQ